MHENDISHAVIGAAVGVVFWMFSFHAGAQDVHPAGMFKVTVQPQDLPMERVEIHWFLTGPFGGGGQGELQHSRGSHDFFIPEGKAKTLKAIVYCPGYDFATISEPSVVSSTHKASVTMKPLSMIHLSGQILAYKPVADKDPVVCIDYLAPWGMKFFGYADGAVPEFKVAVVPLLPDGSFSAEIPDFSRVPFDARSGPEAPDLQIFVRSKKSGNIMLWLSPNTDATPGSELKIKGSYDNPTMFSARVR